ncbi:MAG: hypothetical protein V3T30_06030, partial [Thermodesulfobacteriota bacterium]
AQPCGAFAKILAQQTISRKKTTPEIFINALEVACNQMKEGMIAISHIPLPEIDINIKAENSYKAYCFISNLFSSVTDFLCIVDPYIDQPLFYRYFWRLPCTAKIQVISSPDKWKKPIRDQIEVVESLFISEYPKYIRKDVDDLHDRYLITEVHTLQLGGSLKDAAKKSDFSIVQLSEAKRDELIDLYYN